MTGSGAAGRVPPLALVAVVGIASLATVANDVARGDAAWAGRAEGELAGRPLPGPIEQAVSAYARAVASRPDVLEARWKLLRALHFAGEFAAGDNEARRRHFERARRIAEEGLDRLASRIGAEARAEAMDRGALSSALQRAGVSPRDVARLYFWSAINWGAWSQAAGLLDAVRQGVANRLQSYTAVTIALEPEYDEGGALRLLGRLHAELPRVPFVSGWVDPEQAVPLIERAYASAPQNPGNRLLLALTLLDLAPERRAEALDLLRRVEALTPRPSMRVEDLAMREVAREALASRSANRGLRERASER